MLEEPITAKSRRKHNTKLLPFATEATADCDLMVFIKVIYQLFVDDCGKGAFRCGNDHPLAFSLVELLRKPRYAYLTTNARPYPMTASTAAIIALDITYPSVELSDKIPGSMDNQMIPVTFGK